MDEKDWIILQTIYEERNITKAAERLYISQPALSYRIQQLEKEFDTKIILRSKRGVEFTSQGEVLVKYAMNIRHNHRMTKEYIQNMDNSVKGILRLGVSSMFARYHLPAVLKEFLTQYPGVEVNVKTGWSSVVTQMLQKDDVHLGIIRGNRPSQEEKHLLKEESIFIVSKTKIDIDDLPNLPRINYQTDSSLKALVDEWWQQHYKQPSLITMEVDRIETCKEMVLHGLGYAIFPGMCLTEDDDLYTINLLSLNNEPIQRKTWLIFRNTSLQLSVVDAFVHFLKEYSSKHYNS